MSDISSDAPSVKIIPPLVYLAGLVIGFLGNIWMPIKVVPNFVAWTLGGLFIFGGWKCARNLCKEFIEVATQFYADALQHEEPNIPGLVNLYGKIGQNARAVIGSCGHRPHAFLARRVNVRPLRAALGISGKEGPGRVPACLG